jgi:hypothetical protein
MSAAGRAAPDRRLERPVPDTRDGTNGPIGTLNASNGPFTTPAMTRTDLRDTDTDPIPTRKTPKRHLLTHRRNA